MCASVRVMAVGDVRGSRTGHQIRKFARETIDRTDLISQFPPVLVRDY